MCGIAGFHQHHSADPSAVCMRMLAALRHRGPDSDGMYFHAGYALGQRRLAVIDLAETGKQPMVSHDGRFVITFNGEIYNYPEIRRELSVEARIEWRGSSDTEVLLEAISHWGIKRSLERANGMFAFALLDHRTGELLLARDRLGEKPLYYAIEGQKLVFASELTAIEDSGLFDLSISRRSVLEHFQHSYVPAPLSIYSEVQKLPAAHFLVWQPGAVAQLHEYWSMKRSVGEAVSNRFTETEEAVPALEAALLESVRMRMISDVPLGAFLSGGVDSSLIVALMQQNSDRPVETFSMGFEVDGYDESGHARAVAEHLGTRHHEHRVTAEDALAIVPELGDLYDEPFADSSQIPTTLVCRMARQHVTVCLSGDGGDELFCGYNRYTSTPAMWRSMQRIPGRSIIGKVLNGIPIQLLDRTLGVLKPVLNRYGRPGRVGQKLHRFGDWMSAGSIDELYGYNLGRHSRPEAIVPNLTAAPNSLILPDWLEGAERFMFHDLQNYLEGDILVKLDRAAMSTSLEGRIPMLDPNVLKIAWRLPQNMKLRQGESKWALKQVLYRHVPRTLIERPKMGFGAPVGQWLRGPLRSWASDLLSRERLEKQGIYDAAAVNVMLQDHLQERSEQTAALWRVLMVQAWLQARPGREARIR